MGSQKDMARNHKISLFLALVFCGLVLAARSPARALERICPVVDGPGICNMACSGDDSCPSGQICCSTGCGQACMYPVDPNLPLPPQPCTIFAGVAKEHFRAVLDTIPAPRKTRKLRLSGLLILKYGEGRDAVCCDAADILHENSLVSSVEFDGAPPKCAEEWALPKGLPGPEVTISDDADTEQEGFVAEGEETD